MRYSCLILVLLMCGCGDDPPGDSNPGPADAEPRSSRPSDDDALQPPSMPETVPALELPKDPPRRAQDGILLLADGQLTVVNGDGSGWKQLTRSKEPQIGFSISPDGRWIAVLRCRHMWRFDLVLLDAEGREIGRLMEVDQHRARLDGQRWVGDDLLLSVQPYGAVNSTPWRVYRVPVRGGSIKHLKGWRDARGAISRSPDGARLCAVLDERLLVGEGGREPQAQLAKGTMRDPVWSPDGEQIAVASFDERWQIVSYPAAGGEARVWAKPGAMLQFPAWRPDGEGLVYVEARHRYRDRGEPEILNRLMSVDAMGTIKRLCPKDGSYAHPKWIRGRGQGD